MNKAFILLKIVPTSFNTLTSEIVPGQSTFETLDIENKFDIIFFFTHLTLKFISLRKIARIYLSFHLFLSGYII